MEHEFKRLASFDDPISARIVKNQLAFAGIRAFLDNEQTVGTDWGLSQAMGGIHVLVSADDFEAARAVLDESPNSGDLEQAADDSANEARSSVEHLADGGGDDVPEEDHDGNEPPPLNEREQEVQRAFRGAVFGLLFLPLYLLVIYSLAFVIWPSELPLRPEIRRKALIAAWITIPMSIVCLIFLRMLVRGYWFLGFGE